MFSCCVLLLVAVQGLSLSFPSGNAYITAKEVAFIRNLPPKTNARQPFLPNLPLLPMKTADRRFTLVLDMDETLVHCQQTSINNPDLILPNNINCYIRPHLAEFLQFVSTRFEVVVFTAATQQYADTVLNYIDPTGSIIRHRLYRNSCSPMRVGGRMAYIKDLSLLGRDAPTILTIDNFPGAFAWNVDNGVPIKSFVGDKSDLELMHAMQWLDRLKFQQDVRYLIRDTFCLKNTIFGNI